MIIRDADTDDFDDLERMGIAFAHAAGLPDVDPDTLLTTLQSLIDNGILKVAVNGSVVGCIGALIFRHWWNRHEIVAQELFWWVAEDHRGGSAALRLLTALEKTAKAQGASKLMMLCLDDLDGNKVAKMYTRLGYAPQEQTFVRRL